MGNNAITDLVEFLEPSDDEDVDEETGKVAEEKSDETTKPVETDETETPTDEKAKEGDESTDEDKEEKEEEPDEIASLKDENAELRQILRQQKKDMSIMQSKLDRIEKRSVKATQKAEDSLEDLLGDETKEDEPELSEIELAQAELSSLAEAKGPVLETLLEAMELNPKYADVREVCSQRHFSDMFEAVGDAIHEKEGLDPTVAAMQAEVSVWKMPNPYRYMYDLIKKYHPRYIKQAEQAKPAAKKTPEKAPSSLANVPGTQEPANKWTAARIDEMPEEELHTVPEDIYEKYLAGDLD